MILLIVNPVSGRQKAKSVLSEIIDIYSAENLDVNVRFTQCRGQARELAMNVDTSLYEKIVCVGGDGTLNEVISGVIAAGNNIPIGYIPLGSTNDFASSIKLSKEIPTAVKTTINGKLQPLDMGDFGGRRNFAYVASFGAFTATSYSTPQATKNAIGHLAYILEGLKDVVNIKPAHIRVTAEGHTFEDDYIFGAVTNSTSIGGIVRLDSELVDMTDGLFEVVLVKNVRNPADLNSLVWSVMNSDFSSRMFDFFHTSSVTFSSDAPITWSLDGEEADAGTDITVNNLPGAVNILT